MVAGATLATLLLMLVSLTTIDISEVNGTFVLEWSGGDIVIKSSGFDIILDDVAEGTYVVEVSSLETASGNYTVATIAPHEYDVRILAARGPAEVDYPVILVKGAECLRLKYVAIEGFNLTQLARLTLVHEEAGNGLCGTKVDLRRLGGFGGLTGGHSVIRLASRGSEVIVLLIPGTPLASGGAPSEVAEAPRGAGEREGGVVDGIAVEPFELGGVSRDGALRVKIGYLSSALLAFLVAGALLVLVLDHAARRGSESL